MKRRLCRNLLCACAVHLVAVSLGGQPVVAAEVNVFGDDFPPMKFAPGARRTDPLSPAEPNLGDQQTLRFEDGRQLHGELVEITSEHVLWHRGDVEGVLRIPREEVAKVLRPRPAPQPGSKAVQPPPTSTPTPALMGVGEAEAVVSLGEQGQMRVNQLQWRDGKVRAKTTLGAVVELAAESVRSLTFAPRGTSRVAAAGGTLIFKNGDELSGSLDAVESGRPLRWRLRSGQEVTFQTERVAGVRFANDSAVELAASLELRTGEWLRGEVVRYDERHLRWHHAILGDLDLDRGQLWRLYPNAQRMPLNGSDDPGAWLRGSGIAQHMVEHNPVRMRSDAWLGFDGRFILRPREGGGRGEKVPGPTRELWAGAERFELSVDFASPRDWFSRLNLNFIGSSEPMISVSLSEEEMEIYVQNAKANHRGRDRTLPFPNRNEAGRRQFNLRAFVNGPAGTIDFFLDGRFLGRTGDAEGDRLTGNIEKVSLETYAANGAQMIVSAVALRPWDGQLRPNADSAPATELANGDVVVGVPMGLADGQWSIESEGGRLSVATDRIQTVQFGGEMQPVEAVARVRLIDGSALLVDRFRRSGNEWTVHHMILGDLRIPASQVSEWVFKPAPARPSPLPANR